MSLEPQPLRSSQEGGRGGYAVRADSVAWALVTASLAVVVWAGLGRDAATLSLLNAVTGDAPRLAADYAGMDRFFLEAAPTGNLGLRFAGFDPANPDHSYLVSKAYFRAVYALYPRRVVAASPATVVNRGADLLEAGFAPTDPWWRGHGVETVLLCALRPDGRLEWSVANPGGA